MIKHIVITGAGSGIGRAIAEQLANSDHAVLLLGRNLESLEETQAGLKQPDIHQSFACDVTKPEQIRVALAESGNPSLYGVVANAGLGKPNQYGEGDDWHNVIETNLTGTYNTIQECLPFLKQDSASYRRILVMSSILARYGAPGFTAYCASKAGLLGMMRSFAAELAPDKILVNAICPSWTETKMAHNIFANMGQAMGVSEEAAYQTAMSQVPLGKMSTPGEIARLVDFLMSGAETSITGQAIDINNGLLMV